MNIFAVIFLIGFRFYLSVMKMAYNSLTRVDIHIIAEKIQMAENMLKKRSRFQFAIFLLDEILLLFIAILGFLMFGAKDGALNWMFPLVFFLYFVIEKWIVSVLAFIDREWVVSRFFKLFVPLYYILLVFLFPAVFLSEKFIDFEESKEDDEAEKEDEERAFIDVATEEGIIEENEKELIKGVLDFGETIVREIMTPRMDIQAVEQKIDYDSLISTFSRVKHSRLPVFNNIIDNITGIVHLKDVLKLTPEQFDMKMLSQKPYFIPETKKVLDLLRELQAERIKMAVILDEYGGTAGIVTIEDLIEEIVGDLEDEHDDSQVVVQKVDENTFLVEGRCSRIDFEEETGIEFPYDDIDTVGGAVFAVFGKIPVQGESVEFQNLIITVEKMIKRRVKQVKIKRTLEKFDAE